ncbi:flagellar M-ring protein FliF [Lachnospiraceae bacterium PF1-21]|uniref:flagellar basal-body MS-ring/collar protein FliF n=1 Tax=Ohessyouella blattaphilus TaxID=2949333 RepID=UPI003E2B40AC
MDKFKEYKDKATAFLKKYNRKTKITFVATFFGILVLAIVVAAILNQQRFTVLYSNITQDEANQIIAKLGEAGVDYQYDESGTIKVPEEDADQARADLAAEGYPKNGFAYDVFTANAGGMTTDSEKQTYKLYELQNRIGATIRLFDDVKDAKVTIALNEEDKYVLSDSSDEPSGTASVVVMMNDGGSPSEKQASAVQRLVAKSVPGMEMENVAVFDGNGIEVSVGGASSSTTSGNVAEEIARLIEAQLTQKVLNVLGPFYGSENIRVSARGTVDMQKVVRETTTYETPEKISEEDKEGIIASESTTRDVSGGGASAGGVTGTEANADQSEYNAGTTDENGGALSESATRDFLVNQIKELGEIDPGVLKDMTIAIAINSDTLLELNMNQLRDLVGNATGIAATDRQNKITIVNAPFHQKEEAEEKSVVADAFIEKIKNKWPLIAIAGGVLLLLIAIIIIISKRRKKRHPEDEEFEKFIIPDNTLNPEILNMKNEKSRELRENVRGFVDDNPELSAQMIRNWLNGGTQDGGDSPE